MTKKHNQADALAGILRAKRGDDQPAATAAATVPPVEAEAPPPPSPAPAALIPRPRSAEAKIAAESHRRGKSGDPNYLQHSMYLRKDTHKRVKRRLEDMETGEDVSDLVQKLLEQWLKTGT